MTITVLSPYIWHKCLIQQQMTDWAKQRVIAI